MIGSINITKTLLKLCLLVLCAFSLSCKKKTTIDAKVFNYALNEPVANATVVLVERKVGSGLFGGAYNCTEIASATTDADGNCSFDKEKLKTRKSFDYYLAITKAYNVPQTYPCGGKTNGFLKVGISQTNLLDASAYDAFLKVQFNDIFNPAIIGDSLFVSINNPVYQIPSEPYPFGGGQVFYWFSYYNGSNADPPFITELQKTNAGKNTIHIRKRKMGVVSTYIDTVKIYPNATKIISINW